MMAPGYSREIESPIDLGTIKVKIGQQINTSKYHNLLNNRRVKRTVLKHLFIKMRR